MHKVVAFAVVAASVSLVFAAGAPGALAHAEGDDAGQAQVEPARWADDVPAAASEARATHSLEPPRDTPAVVSFALPRPCRDELRHWRVWVRPHLRAGTPQPRSTTRGPPPATTA